MRLSHDPRALRAAPEASIMVRASALSAQGVYTEGYEKGQARRPVALYRVKAEAGDPHKSYGVHLNPNKSRRIAFAEGDRVIVLAES